MTAWDVIRYVGVLIVLVVGTATAWWLSPTAGDVICTVALWVVLIVGAGLALWVSAWWVSLADDVPRLVLLGSYGVAWGGVGAAFVVAALGPGASHWHWHMFIWPAAGIGVGSVSFVAASLMMAIASGDW